MQVFDAKLFSWLFYFRNVWQRENEQGYQDKGSIDKSNDQWCCYCYRHHVPIFLWFQDEQVTATWPSWITTPGSQQKPWEKERFEIQRPLTLLTAARSSISSGGSDKVKALPGWVLLLDQLKHTYFEDFTHVINRYFFRNSMKQQIDFLWPKH